MQGVESGSNMYILQLNYMIFLTIGMTRIISHIEELIIADT